MRPKRWLKKVYWLQWFKISSTVQQPHYGSQMKSNSSQTLSVGMGTETRYLIGLGAKLWKTGVSISSDVNGSVIGTGEIMKTHIHLLLLYIYIHIILQILSRQSHQLFLYAIIFKLLSMMHFCYSQFRSRSRGWVQHAQHESPVYDRREN